MYYDRRCPIIYGYTVYTLQYSSTTTRLPGLLLVFYGATRSVIVRTVLLQSKQCEKIYTHAQDSGVARSSSSVCMWSSENPNVQSHIPWPVSPPPCPKNNPRFPRASRHVIVPPFQPVPGASVMHESDMSRYNAGFTATHSSRPPPRARRRLHAQDCIEGKSQSRFYSGRMTYRRALAPFVFSPIIFQNTV